MLLKINPDSSMPNYLQIENQIKEAIALKELSVNDQLPSIRLLAKELNVAIITVKRAYDDLASEGILENRQGKGCFVKKNVEAVVSEAGKRELALQIEELMSTAKRYQLNKEQLSKMIEERMNNYE